MPYFLHKIDTLEENMGFKKIDRKIGFASGASRHGVDRPASRTRSAAVRQPPTLWGEPHIHIPARDTDSWC